MSKAKIILLWLAVAAAIAFMISTIVLAVKLKGREDDLRNQLDTFLTIEKTSAGSNPCSDQVKSYRPNFLDTNCMDEEGTGVSIAIPPQSSVNVTKGYVGEYQVQEGSTFEATPLFVPKPILTPFYKQGLCPVNVNWHLGTEHTSEGQFVDGGKGPTAVHKHRRLGGGVRQGGQCLLYDETDSKFTTPFDWKHCGHMEVGQTYEVHWPHSVHGACGTPNQYQSPFYDGMFCNFRSLDFPDRVLSEQIGVQAQVFVVVNDEEYYYSNLIGGMIVDVDGANDDMGLDVAIYTGSTTGTSLSNRVCSKWGPITWQVDRKCHLISASSFDKMCADMKSKRDDMTEDLEPHGSRDVVSDKLAIPQVGSPTMEARTVP